MDQEQEKKQFQLALLLELSTRIGHYKNTGELSAQAADRMYKDIVGFDRLTPLLALTLASVYTSPVIAMPETRAMAIMAIGHHACKGSGHLFSELKIGKKIDYIFRWHLKPKQNVNGTIKTSEKGVVGWLGVHGPIVEVLPDSLKKGLGASYDMGMRVMSERNAVSDTVYGMSFVKPDVILPYDGYQDRGQNQEVEVLRNLQKEGGLPAVIFNQYLKELGDFSHQ